jgi:hypothetical protein
MSTDEKNLKNLWPAIDQHFRDAATLFQQFPEGVHNVYLAMALREWSRVTNDPMMGEKMVEMVDTLFSEDERGREIPEARQVRDALSRYVEEYLK